MTDNKIIEALECCTEGEDCTHCPLIKEMPYCSDDIMVDALNLIKRQQTEIERLKNEIQITKDAYTMLQTKNEIIKSEAVKEFAVRLKEKAYPFPCAIGVENAVTIRDINDILEEMVGEYDI